MNKKMSDVLGHLHLSDVAFNSQKREIEDSDRIFREIGLFEDKQILRMVFETHIEAFWNSDNFLKTILRIIAEETGHGDILNTICWKFKEELPAIISNQLTSFSTHKKAEILGEESFDLRKGWQRYLMRELGLRPDADFPNERISNQENPRTIQTSRAMPTLHDYQVEIRDSVIAALSKGGPARIGLPMPTGSGKTRVTIESLMEYAQKSIEGLKVLWVAETKELCEQAVGTIESVFLDLGSRGRELLHEEMSLVEYFGGKIDESQFLGKSSEFHKIVFFVSTPEQFESRKGKPSYDWLLDNLEVSVIDEAHGYLDQWQRILQELNEGCHQILLSATPGEDLLYNRVFDWIEPDRTLGTDNVSFIEALQERDYLSKEILEERNIPQIMSELDMWKEYRDFDGKNFESPFWYLAMSEILLSAFTQKSSVLVFVDRVLQARRLSAIVNSSEKKLRSHAFWGEMDPRTRISRARDFRKGDVQILVNVKLLTAGFDAPKVNSIVIARQSRPKTSVERQMVGRGLRGKKMGGTSYCTVIRIIN